MGSTPAEVIARHEARGKRVRLADGLETFWFEAGEGPAVVCVHGVPVSSLVYRPLVSALARRGLRGVAFDLPGTGLADRPRDLDYSWSGLAGAVGHTLDALSIDRCHLVVHDIGGPAALEWALREPGRVEGVTLLNTIVAAASFRRTWTMEPFAIRGIGELWLRGTPAPLFRALMRLQGFAKSPPAAELDAHLALLRRGDGGRAFLRIMRGFELTEGREQRFRQGLSPDARPFPVQVVWGADDPTIPQRQMEAACEILGTEDPLVIPARHWVQRDEPELVADLVASHVRPA